MDFLQPVDYLVNLVSVNNFDVGTEHWVDVIHIIDPHNFYVRPIVYRVYLPYLHAYEDNIHPEKLQPGATVIYQSVEVGCFIRGSIKFIENLGEDIFCDVFAIDYGLYEKRIPLLNIRKPMYSVDVPPLAVHCQLAECKPHGNYWSKAASYCMRFFIGDEPSNMIIRGKTPNSLVVKINDIVAMLAYNGCTSFGYDQNIMHKLMELELEDNFFISCSYQNDGIHLVRVQVSHSSTDFFVAEYYNYQQYLKFRDVFAMSCREQEDLEPADVKEGMAVGVWRFNCKCCSRFERAVVVKVNMPDEVAHVFLVDRGKHVSAPFHRLKAMPVKFFRHPIVAMHCALEENQAISQLNQVLVPGSTLKIKVLRSPGQIFAPYTVQIFSVLVKTPMYTPVLQNGII